jgi:hemolysin activation/secretion protein
VLGSTVFSPAELAQVVQPFENQRLTFEELLGVRTAITRLYTEKGYVTSGAFLPPQDDLASGVIQVQVIEGELERLEIQGLQHVRDRYVRRRLERAAKAPLNLQEVESALQLLQQNPLFSSVRAELKAGTTPGRSVLVVTLKEARAFQAAALVANQDSPSVGAIRGTLFLSHNNVLGFGDRFATDLGLSSGITDFNVGYTVPVNARDGALFVRYQRTRSEIVEPPFSVLDINSTSTTFSFGFMQPIVRTPRTELTLGLSFDLRQSQTFLFGNQPFSFSPGPDLGESKIRVLRFTQNWINRNPYRVLAARSQFSFGLPIFGATQNEAGIDGQFFSWVGQFQWVQALNRDVILIVRAAAQLTPDALLPLEQFSIGGIDTVRGYRQNLRVGDNGFIGSLEIRFPILQQADGIGTVQLTPFVDVGRVWNKAFPILSPQLIASAGLGLNWQVGSAFTARLDWGIPLVLVERQGDTLQDYGVVFSVRLQF